MSDLPLLPDPAFPPPSGGPGVQRLLPIFPAEAMPIAAGLSVVQTDGMVQYFMGVAPVFTHKADDEASFRMFTAQLCAQGTCRQVDILRAFGIPKRCLIRWVNQFRDEGGASFFRKKKVTRHPKLVWTGALLESAQALLDEGLTPSEAARKLGMKEDTVRKAVRPGKLTLDPRQRTRWRGKRPGATPKGTTKGLRSARDAEVVAGRACHDTAGRAAAANGLWPEGAPRVFSSALDVPYAGVLCALPALLANGLLHGLDTHFVLPPGFYPVMTYFLLAAFMLMTRTGPPEALRRCEPGEWGLLLGHDRCPEVKTLRSKLEALAQPAQVTTWGGDLAKLWMEEDPSLAGVLYVTLDPRRRLRWRGDGHVRLYHGSQTKLPPRFVSRQRLCLRSMMDYWVNDQEGRPFFVLTAVDTEGLLSHLTGDLIPRLLTDIPGQPGEAELAEQSDLHRFDIIVDREGFSPKAMREAFSQHRVAITTYRRHPYEPWPASEFQPVSVPMAHGLKQEMLIAARPFAEAKSGLREIRRLTPKGTQTAIVTSNRITPAPQVAGRMFSRWCQENYFRYASQHFGIDRLAGYSTEDTPVTTTLVNPAWRASDAEVRKLSSQLHRRLAEKGACSLPAQAKDRDLAIYQQRMSEHSEVIEAMQEKLTTAKATRKKEPKRIPLEQIPEKDRPRLISPTRKQLVDTLAMLAYRAETAQMLILREHLAREDDARSLAQTLYRTAGDLVLDEKTATLTVRLHRGANNLSDKAVAALLEILNASETQYPGTNLSLKYELVT